MPTAIIDTSAASATLIPAVSGKTIRIFNFLITSNGATTTALKDTDDNAVSGPNYSTGAANGGSASGSTTDVGGLFTLTTGKGLKVTNSGSQPIGGFVVYSVY
jgi:hypothetical protein